MPALPPEWLRHLSTLTSFRLGSCDRGGQPHVCRALAADALPDGRMLVLVAEHAAPRVVAALRATGQAALLMTSPELAQTREQLGLDAHSRVLLVSTEGDTDPQQYLDIVWGGQYPGINK